MPESDHRHAARQVFRARFRCLLACVVVTLAPWQAVAAGVERHGLPDDGVSILATDGGRPIPRGRIDELLAAAARDRGLEAADPIGDAAYLRRVTIDLVGRIPTAAEHGLFFSEPGAERRHRLVRRLVASDRFADRWAVWLGDMLRVRSGSAGGPQLDAFLRRSMREREPYDRIVHRLLTAVGSPGHDGAVGFFAAEGGDPLEMAGVVSQTLLGVRMKCARCHDHPFDHWSQREYYGFAAYFGETRSVTAPRNGMVRIVESSSQRVEWPPRQGPNAGGPQAKVEAEWPLPEETVDDAVIAAAVERRRVAAEPTQDQVIERLLAEAVEEPPSPDGLGVAVFDAAAGAAPGGPSGDLRRRLADLVTDPRNRAFARNLVNRLWATLLGRGIVEPVDDLRADNPPSHPELLDHLADELVAGGYDIGHVVLLVVTSDAYARGRPTGGNPELHRSLEDAFLAARLRPVPAEALHDSLVTAGHLHDVKHPPGANLETVQERVLVRREPATETPEEPAAEPGGSAQPETAAVVAEALLAGRLDVSDADDEDAAMGDLSATMMEIDPLAGMRAASPEQMRRARLAEAMTKSPAASGPPSADEVARLYRVETVTRQVDRNPRFDWAVEMPLPAPPQHFLRLLGQSSRRDIDDAGGPRPHMRQALTLLNGPLVHEAARVGPLEPVGRAVAADRPGDAVRLLYLESLTREPTAQERALADEVIASAASVADGVADLRWAILNSREFRFLP